ncbi:MAG: type II toxin-antitoxin system RelE/ParE family toxin [Candidatus Andersenbacteria bacterium]|nr:type II toxin-antitoxin system RelE/ParE family toxin [Candidatus Andersenbacteria bacterium]
MWRVEIVRKAQKDLARIDSRYRKRLTATFYFIGQDPYGGKKLEDAYGDRYAKRVGDYRIVYRINKNARLVTIIRLGHRQGVYK